MPEELSKRVMKKDRKQKTDRKMKCVSEDKPVNVQSRKKGKAQEEKRRLTEELLRERRQLEARSFAEQRKKEQDVQVEVEQIQEEAAAAMTQCEETVVAEKACETVETLCREAIPERKEEELSYEQLLSEVLAEYLA